VVVPPTVRHDAEREVRSVVLLGDTVGLPRLLAALPEGIVKAIVRAEIRGQQAGELERLANKRGLPLLVQPRHDSPEYETFVARLRELAPDLILVDSYSMLLRADVLEIPPAGCVNVHGALLPEYRGANPIQWALLNGERQSGVTIHYMTTEVDAGDIIARRTIPIEVGDTWLDVYERTAAATEELLREQLPLLLTGSNDRVPQDGSRARSYPRRSEDDGEIDWSWSVIEIYNLIRALVAPHPGASYKSRGERVVVDRYLTIAEVAALKYGPGGRQGLRGAVAELCPIPSVPSDDEISFEVRDVRGDVPRGRGRLVVDWSQSPTATSQLDLETSTPSQDLHRDALSLLEHFARDELGIELVLVG
jgi:methionyl-tRNA formyltransferase